MRGMRVFAVMLVSLVFCARSLLAQDAKAAPVSDLAGDYERTGVVDPIVEAQFKGLGIVLVPPVSIDELLVCPHRGSEGDSEFAFRKQGQNGYVIVLTRSGMTCALSELGRLVKREDGALLLRRPVTLTGEGSRPIHGDQEDRFTKEKLDGVEWLVVETRIDMTKRSWFRSRQVEYRSVVRFRQLH